jgi:processive 1,2-diacylglycerol beta-glucosyltransferase
MIELRDKDKGTVIGSISEEQLQFLIDQLEEESEEDTDYYINRVTLEMFEKRGIDPQLLDILRRALGQRDDMEIEWSRS